MTQEVETIPFPPFLPPHATVMLMGTFPPTPDKRAMVFHYPNFQNDMWRIYGMIFFNDPTHFQAVSGKAFDADKIKAFLWERGIASCPTVHKAIRLHGNASDDFLQVVESVDLPAVLAQMPNCTKIATTGGKATEILLGLQPEKIKLPKTNQTIDYTCGDRALQLTRLPSTSRAYPLSLQKKADAYRAFFQAAGLVE
ncbi:DNA glycosylase [Kingella negevensis]|uniref:Uracil DNA glycosylase superfamily protein n=1 Tax=Kingella negevensis TaxID=1522312 RepID=A0A238TEM1_9NEIS|nr:DNA glycosylase [Kingella negevensis]MDK4680472.1 DNA glycosylase [Kingella negevensis]MDK4681805.1 DNA glycosylase [Kingella negevensis]MDK4685238.1 DNA glycosylase [Kingella negevensis]MDK4690002.1 DNA glycosylase [Kingella negevensis]MDK4692652.1 DNA glycosylase [Kingella negevensis]